MPTLVREAAARLPTAHGVFEAVAYRSDRGAQHVAFVAGQLRDAPVPLVRLHSECMTGDVFRSLRCDCGAQLDAALATIAAAGAGAVVYLDQEGRGIGLANKLRAYALQDGGLDTVDANRALGFPDDDRDYGDAAAILRELGVDAVRLITNNPAKVAGLRAHGIDVRERIGLIAGHNPHNAGYLATKAQRLGHLL